MYTSLQARAIWYYCANMVYLYQLIIKSVLFYILMECGRLVTEMLLMMSGDIESNPGPSEYLSTYSFVFNITKSIMKLNETKLALRGHSQTNNCTPNMLKSPPFPPI